MDVSTIDVAVGTAAGMVAVLGDRIGVDDLQEPMVVAINKENRRRKLLFFIGSHNLVLVVENTILLEF